MRFFMFGYSYWEWLGIHGHGIRSNYLIIVYLRYSAIRPPPFGYCTCSGVKYGTSGQRWPNPENGIEYIQKSIIYIDGAINVYTYTVVVQQTPIRFLSDANQLDVCVDP